MRNILFLSIFLLYTHFVTGQDKQLTADSDTVYWFKFYRTLGNKIKVDTNKNKNSELFFRFWDGYKAIEIIKDKSEVQGNLIFFIQEYKRNKEGRIYSKHVPLTEENANKIYQMISKYRLVELPTYKQIKGWEQGFDGDIYITEFTDKQHFSFKNYWTPTAQKGLVEARQILDFIEELNRIEELKDKFKSFMQKQPFQSWYDGIGSASIVLKIKNR